MPNLILNAKATQKRINYNNQNNGMRNEKFIVVIMKLLLV